MFVGNRMKEVLSLVQRHPGGVVLEGIVRILADRPDDAVERKVWMDAARRLAAAGLLERRAGLGASSVFVPVVAPRTKAPRQSHPRLPGWR